MSRFKHYPQTMADLHNCWLSWNKSHKKTQRFGQYMYNEYVHDGKPFPDLFYAADPMEAYDICVEEIGHKYSQSIKILEIKKQ